MDHFTENIEFSNKSSEFQHENFLAKVFPTIHCRIPQMSLMNMLQEWGNGLNHSEYFRNVKIASCPGWVTEVTGFERKHQENHVGISSCTLEESVFLKLPSLAPTPA